MDHSELLVRFSDSFKLLSTTSTIFYVLLAMIVLLSYALLFYPVFLCNVRHIPGPYISKVTSLWLTYEGYRNNANQYIHSLHETYGPVVRVAPGTISFNSVEAIPAIYGVRSNFPKPASAANMDNYGKSNTFSSSSNEDHRRRRGRYASSYSKTHMTQGSAYEGILHRTKKVLAIIQDAVGKEEPVDIYKIFHYYAIDNASVIASGTAMGLLEGRNVGYSQDLRNMFTGLSYVFYFSTISFLQRIMPNVSAFVLPKVVLKAFHAYKRVQEKNIEHYISSRSVQVPEFQRAVLLRLQEHKDYGSSDLTDMHVASEISDHLLAGADTLVAGLVYTFWELARSKHQAYLSLLIEEVMSIKYIKDGVPASYAALDSLIWLECCVREGLRLHTPSGHIQARVVPLGGATIDGYMIPAETEVGISLYSIQLNPRLFDDPYAFKPRRWLEENNDQDTLQRTRLAWLSFGHGARICVGKELALVQMKLVIGMILSRFSVEIDHVQAESEMEGLQMAVLAPKGGRCLMRFSKRRTDVS